MNKEFALKIFEGFSIERWTDMIRPFEVVEMDKAAERMVLSYIIGKFEENLGKKVDWEWMIYASLFELLRKIALCDIKSPVQRLIKTEFPYEYKKLNDWVIEQYTSLLDSSLLERFKIYLSRTEETPTERIFRAAHKFSTLRELEMISTVNESQRLEPIKKEVFADLQEFLDLVGLQMLITRQRPFDFLMRIEQLRFQTRWNQTPRVPRTSVLGHCFFVAVLTLLFMHENNTCENKVRLYNNFFSALFHDLPEAVTRDIISPVKQATYSLPSIVKNIEEQIVAKDLVPLMENFYKDEILYFTSDEFENRVFCEKKVKFVTWEALNSIYTNAEYIPVDGKLVRLSDHFAALLEADSSIRHGITSVHLSEGKLNLLKNYPEGLVINGIDAFSLFRQFA